VVTRDDFRCSTGRNSSVSKLWSRFTQRAVNLSPGDSSEAENSTPFFGINDRFEPDATVSNFFGGRLVVGRGAVARCNDQRVSKRKTIVYVDGFRLITNTSFVKSAEQPIAGSVTREHTSGSVSAVGGGGKSHDKKFCFRVAKWRNRFCPVSLAYVPLGRVGGHVGTPSAQPLTPLARRN